MVAWIERVGSLKRIDALGENAGLINMIVQSVLVSSSRQGEQTHWKEWIGNPASEAARFAYVASSRPRHILIWAVKTLKKDERDR